MEVRFLFVLLLIFLIVLAGLVVLQIHLSKKKSKWFGLILPSVFFMLSVVTILGVAIQQNQQSHYRPDEEIEERIELVEDAQIGVVYPDTSAVAVAIIPIFIVTNLPMIVLLLIYAGCREKMRKELEMQKMSIQDLK